MAQLGRAPGLGPGGRRFESHPERQQAGVAELADAQDLKSCGGKTPYRFDSDSRHHKKVVS